MHIPHTDTYTCTYVDFKIHLKQTAVWVSKQEILEHAEGNITEVLQKMGQSQGRHGKLVMWGLIRIVSPTLLSCMWHWFQLAVVSRTAAGIRCGHIEGSPVPELAQSHPSRTTKHIDLGSQRVQTGPGWFTRSVRSVASAHRSEREELSCYHWTPCPFFPNAPGASATGNTSSLCSQCPSQSCHCFMALDSLVLLCFLDPCL